MRSLEIKTAKHTTRGSGLSDTMTRHGADRARLPNPAVERPAVGLKARLVATDLACLTIGWLGVFALRTASGTMTSTLGALNVGWAAIALVVTFLLMTAQNLHLARVCSVRSVELQGLGRSVLGACLAMLGIEQALQTELLLRELWLAGLITFVVLASGRTAYAAWLRRHRAAGRYMRDVLLIGGDPDAAELAAVMREHPELGFRPCGYVGGAGLSSAIGVRHLGTVADAPTVVERFGVTGVVVVASAIDANLTNDLVRHFLDVGIHVHLSSGLRGIAQQRFRATPLAYEPLFYVEPASLTPWQLACKRTIDVVGSLCGLVVTSPVLVAAMIAIKIDSPGRVLFRQQRVGRNGQCFEFLKLRTMVCDAESRRPGMEARNRRTSGPLFKVPDDPRITRVGRVLRATSIDELPQLWNVLRGSMSLVGPRPALPSEVEQFDERLQTRTRVLPGLTGLWQIEARDNPAFGPYRRLDLFYVENWSPLLDLGIIATTIVRVVARSLHFTRASDENESHKTIVLD